VARIERRVKYYYLFLYLLLIFLAIRDT